MWKIAFMKELMKVSEHHSVKDHFNYSKFLKTIFAKHKEVFINAF